MLLKKILLTFLFLFTAINCRAQEHFRFIITGNLNGAIKNCKCPNGQPGGIARRKAIFDRLRGNAPEEYFIDCGNISRNSNSVDELDLLVKLYKLLNYDYINCYLNKFKKNPNSCEENSNKLKVLISTPGIDNFFRAWIDSKPEIGITVLLKNLSNSENEDDPVVAFLDSFSGKEELDILIVGGGGFIHPDVVDHEGTLLVYPGIYGEYVTVLDIWTVNGNEISKFEWELIPSEGVKPDSEFVALIDSTLRVK